jgi:hypothetical protein
MERSELTVTENKWGRWRTESRVCSPFSLTSRGLFTKNSAWKAKQLILHNTVTFYGDCMKVYEDFAPNFGGILRTSSCIMTTYRLILPFLPGNF